MTAIFLDGFDHYGTGSQSITNMLAGTYSNGGNGSYCTVPSWGGARTGNYCLMQSGNEQNGFRKVLPASNNHLFVSFGFACDALPFSNGSGGDSGYSIISFLTGTGQQICKLGYTPTGAIQLLDQNNNVLVITSGPVIKTENWHFMEMEINITSGTFTLRVDDAQATNAPVLSYTGSFLGSVSIVQLLPCFTGASLQIPCYMDDLFIRDSTGTYNNGWLGDRRVATLFAAADTATKNWTPSYYHEFNGGILSLAVIKTGTQGVQNWSAYIGTTAATALDLGNSDFTLETFVRFDALPTSGNYSVIFNRWDSANNRRSYRLILGSQSYNNGSLEFDISTDGTSSTIANKIVYPWQPTLNTWYHVAVVRASGELLLFVNGQQLGLPIASSETYFGGGSEGLFIGNEVQAAGTTWNATVVNNTYLVGRLDETRITNGFARYTSTFTTPTAAFPRGAADPNWAQVALLMGYDSGVIDESSYNRAIAVANGATQFTPNDGPAIGYYSTVNKATPDDNTFISASLTNASNIFTMTTQPANGDTVTVGTKDGTNAAVYTFKTAIASAFDVLIDTTAQNTLLNLLNAINAGPGSGTKYGTGTTSNYDVNAVQLPAGQFEVVANLAGTGGNSIASTHTGTAASWATTTLTGGANIPGPTNFKFQRPPNNTTIISALQTNVRALKTDAGTANIQTALIGALGGTKTGAIHPLTVSGNYYSDLIETDPDSNGALSPTTIINGQFQINRTS